MADPVRSRSILVANVLSDLNSLRLSDPAAALSLTSTRAATADSGGGSNVKSSQDEEADLDLRRAQELLDLFAFIKATYTPSVAAGEPPEGQNVSPAAQELAASRQSVEHVKKRLGITSSSESTANADFVGKSDQVAVKEALDDASADAWDDEWDSKKEDDAEDGDDEDDEVSAWA